MLKNKSLKTISFISMFVSINIAYAENTCESSFVDSHRYIINEDGTAKDSKTTLVWQRCSIGRDIYYTSCQLNDDITSWTMRWDEALQHAETINNSGGYAGHTNWRVPNRNELMSLYEGGCINNEVFPHNSEAWFWSSTPAKFSLIDDSDQYAWYVNRGHTGQANRTTTHNVRLVRDEAQID